MIEKGFIDLQQYNIGMFLLNDVVVGKELPCIKDVERVFEIFRYKWNDIVEKGVPYYNN